MMRKIAANYLFFPGHALVKNGYVEFISSQEMRIVDTEGQLRDLAGLEFYGGMLVPDYICEYTQQFREKVGLLPLLEKIFKMRGERFEKMAIIEGADLIRLEWTEQTTVRLL